MSQHTLQSQAGGLRQKGQEIFGIAKRVAGPRHEIEIILESSMDENLRFGNNELGQSQFSTSHTLSVRVASNKRQARTTTGRLDKSYVEHTVEKAIAQAKAGPEDPDYLQMLEPQKYKQVNRYHERTIQTPAEQKAGYVGHAIDLAKKNRLLASGVLGTSGYEALMLNTSGLEASYRGTSGYFSLTMDADNGNQTGYALSTFTDIGELKSETVSDLALERALMNKSQVEVSPGKYNVVIDPYAWSETLFFLVISAAAGFTPDFGMRQYKEGRSYLTGRLGEKIMGDNVTIEDDAYHPLQSGPSFDGEGYPKNGMKLVENGILRNVPSSRISAKRYPDAKPTGHELPLPNPLGEAPLNLIIHGSGKQRTLEELIGELDKGLLITRLWYIREVEARSKTLTGMTRDGTFLVENGEIKKPVRNLRFNQSLLELLSNIEEFSAPVRSSDSTQFTMLQPGILARDFNFTSVSPF
ncbi:MAG TPA: TldD/PmbA family protein [Candidatus Bathyarchaeia archaeon]|nr:TldD/PmbA family protein [Candidatus Bathyarchaeia archaeon]